MTGSQYSETVSGPSSVNGPDHPNILLAISRRLIVATKLKNILYIETAMEMMALAISISSEVCDVANSEYFHLISLLEQRGVP
jgi:hypothetical protein